jgi:23S rRNA (uracil1939-C5)-methyltransferase
MIKSLIQSKPKVIIYSSCNPDTFARDIRQLIAGGYSIDYIQGFDMFPNTKHLEVVGVIYLK